MVIADDNGLTLQPLTAANWRACPELDLFEYQRTWVPSNLLSIAAAQFYPDNVSRAIVFNGQVVGFGLYGVEQGTGRIKVFRLMIGHDFQRRGFGRAAMHLMLRDITSRWPDVAVYVSYQSENAVARRLYTTLGFVEIEEIDTKITACQPPLRHAKVEGRQEC